MIHVGIGVSKNRCFGLVCGSCFCMLLLVLFDFLGGWVGDLILFLRVYGLGILGCDWFFVLGFGVVMFAACDVNVILLKSRVQFLDGA